MRNAAVLGAPVAHSLSPVLHQAAYAALGLDWRYHALTCREPDLPELVSRCRASGRWAGLSLTMPLKEAAAAVADRLNTDLGVVNTLVFDGTEVVGHNTDVDGVRAALQELGAPLGRVALLGAGGTARAAVQALAELGTTALTVYVRNPQRAAPVVALARQAGLDTAVEPLAGAVVDAVTVSTLPAAAAAELLAAGLVLDAPLLDVVYAPWPTALAEVVTKRGHPVVGGLAVLVGQAASQVVLMTGRPAPVQPMRDAGEAALASRAQG